MKILFDENEPLPLRQFLTKYSVHTVQSEGWAGVENGELIRRADRQFDVLILADKNLRYQQNLSERSIALIELPTDRWLILKQLSARIITAVEQTTPGSYTIIDF